MPAELDNMDPEMDQEMDSGMDQEMGAEGPEMGMGDQEGAMAKQELIKLANYASNLQEHIADDEELEAWVQSKITIAATNIASVYHYLAYEKKIGEYGDRLDSEPMSESKRQAIKGWLMEAKSKVKELKKAHAEKVKEKKIEEGILSGGEQECAECGGTGMVNVPGRAVPEATKEKVRKYNTIVKATKAAHKRIDANKNGIPDDEEMEEGFGDSDSKEMKVGDKKKTRTGELEKTSTGVKHTNTSYKDDGDEIASNAKSGKGVKSHAKAQSAAEKKEKAPAQKQSPKSAKTWGMKDGEKFDNRDKEKDVGEGVAEGLPQTLRKVVPGYAKREIDKKMDAGKFGKTDADKDANFQRYKKIQDKIKEQGVYEAKKKGDGNLANNAKPYDKVTRGDVIAGRLGKDEKGGKDKKVKEAAAMWKNIKETTAYIEEKKNLPGKQEKIDVAEPKGKIDGKDMAALRAKKETVKESSEVSRLRELTGRLNQNEKQSLVESGDVASIRALTKKLLG
jgi:hypothetical protein